MMYNYKITKCDNYEDFQAEYVSLSLKKYMYITFSPTRIVHNSYFCSFSAKYGDVLEIFFLRRD